MKKLAKTMPNVQLKRARELKGWSQEQVGQEIGTDAFTVSRWERGVTIPGPHFRQKLCALFEMSVVELGLVPPEIDEPADAAPVSSNETKPAWGPILDPAIPPPPAGEHGLVGRDDLLRTLKQRLLSGKRVALSALNGLPGVGKTALATALVHDEEVRAHFADGVLWAGLGYEPDVVGLLSRWGTVLGCPPPDLAQRNQPDAWAASIHAAIGQKRMLLVLDDAWDIAPALAFQVGGPHCAHMVTTRFPEIARHFAPDGAIAVRELADMDARLLLIRLAPEVVEAEPQESGLLVEAVGGLPLALTLLGNYLRAQAHSGQPRRIRAALERLRSAEQRLRLTEPQALIGHHPSLSVGTPLSLQAVIGISDQQVDEEARATLRALAVFPPKPNTFSEEAAIGVSAMPVETLDRLTDAGLVESSGAERYTLHQTIADYARSHLTDAAVAERLVAYFIAYVEAHAADYTDLDRESSNILAALDAAFERKLLPELVRGVHAFAPLLITRGFYPVAEAQLQRSLEAAQVLGDAIGSVTALLHLGEIAEQRGNFEQAQIHWQNGLMLARQSKQDRLVAETLMELGVLARQQGQPEQARQFLEEARDVSRQVGDRGNESRTLRNLGILEREQGKPELARKLYEEALVSSREVGNQREVARTLNNLAILERQQGRPERARQLLEEALAIFRRLEDRRGAANTLGNLSRIAENLGQPEQARQLYEQALDDFRQLGDRRSVAQVLHNLGTLAWEQGQPELARRLYGEALDILRQLGDRRILALTLTELGVLTRGQGQSEQAHKLLTEALDTLRQLGDRRESAAALRELGNLAREQGQMDRARLLLEEALDTYRQLEDRREVARSLKELGILAREQRLPEQAYQLLEEAADSLRKLGDSREVARCLLELGILKRQQGQLEEAYQFLTDALAIMRQMKDRRNVASALKETGILMQQQGKLGDALHLLLSAGVGLELVASPDVNTMENILKQVYVQSGRDGFIATARDVSKAVPELAYGLDEVAWVAAVRKLVMQALANQ